MAISLPWGLAPLVSCVSFLLWVDEILHHFEAMVETVALLGIYLGELNHSVGFLGW